MLLEIMVKKRGYVTEEELLELNALCQILPGPTSTQTITAIGFKIGGPNLAYLALLVWIAPAFILMTGAGILIATLQAYDISANFTKYIMPVAVAFVAHAAYKITRKVVRSHDGIILMIVGAVGLLVALILLTCLDVGCRRRKASVRPCSSAAHSAFLVAAIAAAAVLWLIAARLRRSLSFARLLRRAAGLRQLRFESRQLGGRQGAELVELLRFGVLALGQLQVGLCGPEGGPCLADAFAAGALRCREVDPRCRPGGASCCRR